MRHCSLRGNPADGRFLAACEAALGARLPLVPNTASGNILWLGPDEWLIVDATDEALSRLRAALQGIHSALVDVSASREAIDVAGPRAEAILSMAATLDFRAKAFPVGACAQTSLARTQGIIHRLSAEHFRLYVRTSFARYLRAWLKDAAEGATDVPA